jgi:hypothetical protein
MNPNLQKNNLKNSLNFVNVEKFNSVAANDNSSSNLKSAPVNFSDLTSLGGLFMKKKHSNKNKKIKIIDERRTKRFKVKEESNRKFSVGNRGKKESIYTFRNLIILVLILSVIYYFFSLKNKQNN